ncbi:hypothetical protein [Rhizobium sp. 768_B6_N1_8]|uniref:hypothetical protein n=1 Tax=unclassified Rhizobium TaxID=2613769 RepID=UPI003F239E3D
MIKWIKDALGVTRYFVAWNFETNGGICLSGNSVERHGHAPYAKKTATYIADEMCKIYGKDTHWIEAA